MPTVLQRVLPDADVLFSRTLRDWLLLMSSTQDERSLYTICWTDDILAETQARIRDARPELHSSSVELIGERLRELWKDGRIASFSPARESFIGQDLDDLHVHSAAVGGDVDVVLTNDRKGLFPTDPRLLDTLPYEIQCADDFLVLVAEQTPHVVRACAHLQLSYRRGRGEQPDLPGALRQAQAPRFAEAVRQALQPSR